jgi:hypothetical protein
MSARHICYVTVAAMKERQWSAMAAALAVTTEVTIVVSNGNRVSVVTAAFLAKVKFVGVGNSISD